MIEIISNDGDLDTQIEVSFELTICGKELNDFENELLRLLDKYSV